MKAISRIFGDFRTDGIRRREREFLPAASEFMNNPPRPFARLTLWTICIMLTAAIIWAIVGEVDEIAIAPGTVIPRGYVKTIQAEDGGVVKAIAVHEGERVKVGQLLIELDATINHADMSRLLADADYYRMQIDCANALIAGNAFWADKARYPYQEQSNITAQNVLFKNKQAALLSRALQCASDISVARAALVAEQATESKYSELLKNSAFIEQRAETGNKQDGVSLFQLYEYKDKRVNLQESLSAQRAIVTRAAAGISQSLAASDTVQQCALDELNTKLVENEHALDQTLAELAKIERKATQRRIVSPIDGCVSQMSVRTIGGVLTPAQALMTIVPAKDGLTTECWIANKDIGFVHAGQRARLKMDTYNFQKFGTIDATIVSISPDAIEHETTAGAKEYAFRADIVPDRDCVYINNTPARISPGMTLSAEIVLRKKRIIDFFIEPFKKYSSEAFRER